MNSSGKLIPIVRAVVRNINTTAVKEAGAVQEKPSPRFHKLKENQKRFQIEDGVPVYLKKGTPDRILFQATLGLLVIGLGMSVKVYYDLIFGKR